ncbi:hypothetical protein [Inediibacterium massiliense]|uniref:hypothetical protein n=1 Tax=Inediibacterium massiliense TaxID=1658111 RepID=UPI0006B60DE4|nr:hypothetical protein [Inediibacterium massiliense]
MKIKLGIIGSVETVERVKDILIEFEEKIEAFIYCYKHKQETLKILKECQKKVDVLLFTGQVPFAIAQKENMIQKPFVFIPRTGTSVYRVFWQMNVEGMDYKKISFDTIEQKNIQEAIKDLEIPIEKFYVKSYPGDIDYNELVKYHYELWKEKKVNVVATCLGETYRNLKKLGVPVFRLYPTRPLIREYITKAIYKGNVERIKATQIAVQIVKTKNKNRSISSEYEFLKLKNKLEKGLISYTQDNFGSIFPFGRDEYLIFTTRGAIDAHCNEFNIHHFIQDEQNIEIELASGIGFGNTIHEAEVHARIALDYAMKEDCNCCYIMDENTVLSGPIQEKESFSLSYDLMVENEEIQKIAKDIQISPTYVCKMKAIFDKIGTNTIEAEELANYLGISVRSARRILKQIVDAKYGKNVAQESRTGMGRPRKIYKITF